MPMLPAGLFFAKIFPSKILPLLEELYKPEHFEGRYIILLILFFINGIQRIPERTTTAVAILPTLISSFSDLPGRILLYISIVNNVEQELNTEESELINAASNPPATKPRIPEGNNSFTKAGNA